ncbi:MAG: fructosamine kinase family protein, partial [Longimicrobiales bacterium]
VHERWLLLEWLEPGRANTRTMPDLGNVLARAHHNRGEAFGWPTDNFIGSLPQGNDWMKSWPEFWRSRRLLPQLERAYAAGHFDARDRRRFDVLLERLEVALANAAGDGPSLLHGDLWSGNVHVMRDGSAALVDPSSYYGHREVDLAMAELFGGFDRAFFDAYREAWPVAEGYREVRRPIYQLYYLLVHVNHFGAGYVAGSKAAVEAALSTLGSPPV